MESDKETKKISKGKNKKFILKKSFKFSLIIKLIKWFLNNYLEDLKKKEEGFR